MYLLGYSLDNLSLMALTIAVGFVVDDAIVMLENIVRHIEEGKTPMRGGAARAPARSASPSSRSRISLVAVFIPLLLMGGIVGRLFREFAVTVGHDDRRLGVRLADADADDVRAASCKPTRATDRHGRLYRCIERGFDGAAARLRPRPRRRSCATASPTLLVFLAHRSPRPAALFIAIPKGFFPQQDTGLIIGTSEAAQDISFARHVPAPAGAGRRSSRSDPGRRDAMPCRSARAAARRRSTRAACSSRLKPQVERDVVRHEIIARLRPQARRRSKGIAPVPAGRRRTSTSAAAQSRTPVPVHAAGRQSRRAQRLGAEDPRQAARRSPSCATSRPTSR